MIAKLPMGFPGGASGNESACQSRGHEGCKFDPLGWEDPVEKEMATHPSILAWRIPWTEEPGGLQSRGRKESDKTTHTRKFPTGTQTS